MPTATFSTSMRRGEVISGDARFFVVTSDGTEVPIGSSQIEIPVQNESVQLAFPEIEDYLTARRRRRWERAYLEEEKPEDANDDIRPIEPGWQNYDGNRPAEFSVKPMEYSLQEIAQRLPAGVLGMHHVEGKPFALVFRSERENDPRKKILKGTEWFEVRKEKEVLWAAPTLEAYNTLEDTGLEFKKSDKVKQWLRSILPQYTEPVEFEENCPLFDYQRDAASFMVRRDRAMLSLSPGLGKTLTSAYAAGKRQQLYGDVHKILLVCPASLLHYWYGELEKWEEFLPCTPLRWIWHKETGELNFPVGGDEQVWVITNPETLVKNLAAFRQGFDLAIVDESIMFKHRDSRRSVVLHELCQTIEKVWLVTGAPATRYLDDLWHQFHILNSRGYSSFWRFADRYCVVMEDVWGKSVVANRRGAEQQVKENFADIYFARNQDQVANIPDWLFEDVDIPMKPKQDAVYEKLRKELAIQIMGYPDDYEIKVNNRLSLVLRSLQVASNPLLVGAENSSGKWSALPELMEVYPGPYIVWVNFIRTGEILLDNLRDQFGSEQVYLANGATPMIERDRLVRSFQREDYKVIILNNTVGKFGFTLTKARTAFFVERAYDDSYFQCLHRNRRIGTVESPVIVNMRSVTRKGKQTIDHAVHDALDYRNFMIKKITVGDLRKVFDE